MQSTDLTFFTNAPENTLNKRFEKILKKDTKYFDVLVGYFRASGFYLLKDAMDNIEKTRILIGINTDENVLNMIKEAKGQVSIESLSNIETKNRFKDSIQQEFEVSEDAEEVESGVIEFLRLLKEGKIEIRVYKKQPIHAKIYIMREDEESPDFGRVITGSSNFSYSGLMSNLEFNVELKNRSDVEFALERFEELWKESVEVNEDCIETIENKTWVIDNITPYEMYVKFLYEYFKEEINDDLWAKADNSKYYPDGFKPLQYQKDAVLQAKRILEKHGGIFISDVVGLGKTYICALLAQELEGKKLILCPPVLVDYWESVIMDFGIRGVKVESEGKLDKIIEMGAEQFSYVFVDESHRFRNAGTEAYQLLHQICVGKKVILISATPQNNYITDIANQLYLFQSKNNSTIVTARNLEVFFDNLRKKVKMFERGTPEYKQALKDASDEIRDKVLREVMIRRTRTEIQKNYGEDLKKQKLEFPKLSDPVKLVYEFDEKTDTIFEKTVAAITELNYSRYKPLMYVQQDKLSPEQRSLITGQRNMGGFMKGILIKRLESSKYAFEMTLNRFINSYEKFIDMYNSGIVWISKKIDVQEFLDKDDIDALLEAVEEEKVIKFETENFSKEFKEDLYKDINILKELKNIWGSIEKDCKLEFFIDALKKKVELKNNKLLIFTESKETAEYLKESLEKNLHEPILSFNGTMPDSMRLDIRQNFDPTYKKEKQKNDYRVLITTDVLAEGMNLHRSNVIINYDLPWNPTRIMQRVGRINRVGTSHKEIHIFNFFPTSKSNQYMSLEDNIISKMQMFHDILGEDSKFLTDDEEISTHELFRRISVLNLDEDEVVSELSYLKLIRTIRDKEPELFNKIKNYPKKIKIGRKQFGNDKEELITFFRRGYLKRFYLSTIDCECQEITFEQAIEKIKALKAEKATKVGSKYYDMLRRNKEMFEIAEAENKANTTTMVVKKGSSNAKNIIKVLKECLKSDSLFIDDDLEKINKIIDLLESGELPSKLIKEGNRMIKEIKSISDIFKFFKEFENSIPKVYLEEETKKEKVKIEKKNSKEIVLSEFFVIK